MTVTDTTDLRELFERAGTALPVDTGRLRDDLGPALDRPGSGRAPAAPCGRSTAQLTAAAACVAVLALAGGLAAWRAGRPDTPTAGPHPAVSTSVGGVAPGGGGSTDPVPGLSLPPAPVRTTEAGPHVLPGTPTLPASQRTVDSTEPARAPGQDVVHLAGPVTPVLAYDNGYRERIWALAPGRYASGAEAVCRLKIVDGVDVDDPGMWDESIWCMGVPAAGRLTLTGKAALLTEDFDSIPYQRTKTLVVTVVAAQARSCVASGAGVTVPLSHRVPVAGSEAVFAYGVADPDLVRGLSVTCTR